MVDYNIRYEQHLGTMHSVLEQDQENLFVLLISVIYLYDKIGNPPF